MKFLITAKILGVQYQQVLNNEDGYWEEAVRHRHKLSRICLIKKITRGEDITQPIVCYMYKSDIFSRICIAFRILANKLCGTGKNQFLNTLFEDESSLLNYTN
ncbi:hypothetical protein OTU49_006404, partial [Cherax quadricarinatus]